MSQSRTIKQLFDLTGQVALVTGGSRGLGLQMAHALGEAGAKVMLTSRKAEDLAVACAELQAAGIDAEYLAADCSQEEEIRQLAQSTVQKMGKVDILINNAGASWGSPAEKHPLSAWDKVMNVNIRGYFILSQEIANLSMIPNKKGRIVNIASIAGLAGNTLGMQTVGACACACGCAYSDWPCARRMESLKPNPNPLSLSLPHPSFPFLPTRNTCTPRNSSVQHIQRRSNELHPRPGRRVGPARHHCQHHLPWLFS